MTDSTATPHTNVYSPTAEKASMLQCLETVGGITAPADSEGLLKI